MILAYHLVIMKNRYPDIDMYVLTELQFLAVGSNLNGGQGRIKILISPKLRDKTGNWWEIWIATLATSVFSWLSFFPTSSFFKYLI